MEAKHQHQYQQQQQQQRATKSARSHQEDGGGGGGVVVIGSVGGPAGHRAEMEMQAKIQKAVDFKLEGHRCYKEKKFREAIGKYHRALLQLKGVHGSEVELLNQAASRLTEEQRRAVESTEIECYDSLTGELSARGSGLLGFVSDCGAAPVHACSGDAGQRGGGCVCNNKSSMDDRHSNTGISDRAV